jgi:hypothetical protein
VNDDLLRRAKDSAERLLAQLLAQQDDLDAFAARQQLVLAPDQVAAGRRAFERAVESTRQTLARIDQALQTAR